MLLDLYRLYRRYFYSWYHRKSLKFILSAFEVQKYFVLTCEITISKSKSAYACNKIEFLDSKRNQKRLLSWHNCVTCCELCWEVCCITAGNISTFYKPNLLALLCHTNQNQSDLNSRIIFMFWNNSSLCPQAGNDVPNTPSLANEIARFRAWIQSL